MTIYGILDAGVSHTSASGQNITALAAGNVNGNRLGFKGSEDLGGGLKAIFDIEMGLALDTGATTQGATFGRQAWTGLAGSFGSVTLGRQYSPGYYVFLYDTQIPLTLSPAFILQSAVGLGNANAVANQHRAVAGFASRTSNSIVYDTPDFNGFTAKLIYGFGEVASDASQGRTAAVGLDYKRGPFGVA